MPIKTTESSEIAPMVELINESKIRFMVGFNRTYRPMMRDLKPIFKKHRDGNTTIIYRIVGKSILWPEHHYDTVVNR